MALVFRSVPRSAFFVALATTLTHCSTLPPTSKWAVMKGPLPAAKKAAAPAPKAPSVAMADDESDDEKALDADLDSEFRLDALRRDIARAIAKATPKKKPLVDPEARQIAKLPIQRLVPEWKPIAPEGAVEGETPEDALPRRLEVEDDAMPAPKSEPREPGTVAESSSEEIDALYEAEVHLRAGRLDRGLAALHRFLERDPRHAYADRAERRIAEAHFDAGEWTLAIAAANRCVLDFPGTLAAEDAVRIRSKAQKALGLPMASSAGKR